MAQVALKDVNSVSSATFESSTTPGAIFRGQIDQVTGRVLVESAGASGTVTEVDTGTGLTGGPITTTGTISLDTKLAPMDTLTGNSLKVLRVNAGETAVEYATPSTGTVTTTGSPASGNLTKFSGTTSVTNADLTGDITTSGGVGTTLATVNSNVGSFTNASVTVNGKGLVTAASSGTAPVTAVSVATANGFSGSSSGGTTPALTIVAGAITPTSVVTSLVVETAQAITVTSNAGTADVTHGIQNFTNSSAATMAITLATTSAVDGQKKIIRIYDFSAVTQTVGWTNTENSTVSVPTTSNGSTTLPLTVGFQFNGATSKWRCLASA